MHALQNCRNTLQAHTSIHARFWQRMHNACFIAIKLHKHVIPNFNKAIAIFVWTTRRAACDMCAMVIEYFRTRATRAGVTHHPEIIGCITCAFIVANTNDFFGRQANFFKPNIIGFIIFSIDSNQQLFYW